jgi:endonuclease YncB( thermonuclease family)
MLFPKTLLLYFFILSAHHSNINTILPTEFTAKVVAIKDGDSIEVLYEGKTLSIRLADVDCPETRKSQPYGRTAKKFTSSLCFGQMVKVQHRNKFDKYKRLIATIINAQNKNVNKELVIAGLAWHFKQYSSNTEIAKLEITARVNKVGLWKDAYPVAPWAWRKLDHQKITE